jgi:hypothetical protein
MERGPAVSVAWGWVNDLGRDGFYDDLMVI